MGVGVKSIHTYTKSIIKHSGVWVIVGVIVIVGVGVNKDVKEGVGVNRDVTEGVKVGVGVMLSQYK